MIVYKSENGCMLVYPWSLVIAVPFVKSTSASGFRIAGKNRMLLKRIKISVLADGSKLLSWGQNEDKKKTLNYVLSSDWDETHLTVDMSYKTSKIRDPESLWKIVRTSLGKSLDNAGAARIFLKSRFYFLFIFFSYADSVHRMVLSICFCLVSKSLKSDSN